MADAGWSAATLPGSLRGARGEADLLASTLRTLDDAFARLIVQARTFATALARATATQSTRSAIDEVTRQMRGAERAMGQAQQVARAVAKDVDEAFKNATSGIAQGFGRAFEGLLTGGRINLQQLAQSARSTFHRLAADLLTDLVRQPFRNLLSVLGGAPQAGSGSSNSTGTGQASPPISWQSLINFFNPAPGASAPAPPSWWPFPLAGTASVVGSALPGLLGGNPIQSVLGGGLSLLGSVLQIPFGGPLGGLVGNLVGGLFAPKPSVGPGGGIQLRADPAGGLARAYGVGDNGFDADATAGPWADALVEALETFRRRYGGRLTALDAFGGEIGIGFDAGRGKYSTGGGDISAFFESPDAAIAGAVRLVLAKGDWQGLEPMIARVATASKATTLDELMGDIAFGRDFDRQIASRTGAADPAARQAADILGAAQRANETLMQAIDAFVTRAETLFGAESSEAVRARAARRTETLGALGVMDRGTGDPGGRFQVLDPKALSQPLDGLALRLRQGEAEIDAYRHTLERLGYATGEVTDILATAKGGLRARLAGEFDAGIAAQTLALTSPAAAGLQTLLDQHARHLADARALGGSDAEIAARVGAVDRLHELELEQAARRIATGSAHDSASALHDLARAANQNEQAFTRLRDGMAKMRQDMAVDPALSPLSPQARLAEATRQFDTAAARAGARDGDGVATLDAQTAMAELPALGRVLLQTARDNFGATEAYATAFARVDEVLRQTEASADQQVSLARRQLDLAQAQLEALQTIAAGANAGNPNRNWGARPVLNRTLASITGYGGDFGTGGFNAFRQGLSPALQQIVSELERVIAFARGGVLDRGHVVPFATGGVGALVTTPSWFPLGDGRTGLMGEAGPEAIMPIARMASGHLGVRAVMPAHHERGSGAPLARLEAHLAETARHLALLRAESAEQHRDAQEARAGLRRDARERSVPAPIGRRRA